MKRIVLVVVVWFVSACGLLGIGDGSDGGTGGSGAGNTGGSGGAGGSTGGWKKIEPPEAFTDSSVYVYGVHCTTADACVIATSSGRSRGGGLFALGASAWGELLVDGDYEDGTLAKLAGQVGDIQFLGFLPTRNGLVARITSSGAIVSASGNFTSKASWSAVKLGTVVGGSFGGNATVTLQSSSDTDWVFANNNGFVYSATQAPSASTAWTQQWSPNAVPSVPADFEAQITADRTLCDWDITPTAQPYPSQPFWAATDLSVLIYPANGLNQTAWRKLRNREAQLGAVKPGLCISTDKGRHFYFKEFPENLDVSSPGPFGVTCLDKDTCFAFNGTGSQANSYIYFSTNASQAKASTWTKATIPAGFAASTNISIDAIFFAPDKTHGWAVGNNSRKPMLLRTTDAGRTWVDVSGQVSSLATSDLINGFALDANRIWVVGRYGFVGTTNTAQN